MKLRPKRRALVGIGILCLMLGGGAVWYWSRPEPDPMPTPEELAIESAQSYRKNRVLLTMAGPVKKLHPVKEALINSTWEIVVRRPDEEAGADEPKKEDAADTPKKPRSVGAKPRVRIALEFVRANFNAAGMRGVHRFAAFSPPQYAAIKKSILRLGSTNITAAPEEFVASGEEVGFDLQDDRTRREYSIDLIPTISGDGKRLRLETVTSGTRYRRDGNLPIWDGQTVMVLLGDTTRRNTGRQLAAFITVRIVDGEGNPVHEFVVHR